jgi:hypothetical protein
MKEFETAIQETGNSPESRMLHSSRNEMEESRGACLRIALFGDFARIPWFRAV